MKEGKWRGGGGAESTTVLQEQKAPLLARVAGIAVVLVLAGVLVVWGVDLGRRLFGASQGVTPSSLQQRLDEARIEIATLKAERDALLAAAKAAPEGGAAAAAAASAPVAGGDLAAARLENGKLAADLALAEKALPLVPAGGGLVIQGLQARMATPRLLHYTILLGYGPKKGGPARFAGRLTVAVTISKDGKRSVMEFPVEKDAARYDITVQRNQRLDGTLELPEGAAASAIEISIAAKGKVVAKQAGAVLEHQP
ncbi:hypothetical protein [Pseudoduganella namucuonensis]|uniref:Uncharacterized protein n=1 Tax=Pseudoduganella namucuonensis TaxID=1035707 RepID=A0A1I7EU72_9BURK|nr:hypothetical protein [Pseudoduganella namucuonensis]SFU27475.1 hypothetical protein SAMN05216552_100186 [Pseudoduganella namucuonensis]